MNKLNDFKIAKSNPDLFECLLSAPDVLLTGPSQPNGGSLIPYIHEVYYQFDTDIDMILILQPTNHTWQLQAHLTPTDSSIF